jgi:D-sedoheptulose 7-phosphate isomerase
MIETAEGTVARILRQRLDQHQQGLLDAAQDGQAFARAVRLASDCVERDGRLLFCGNGGSAAVTSHLTQALMGPLMGPRPVAALNLSESAACATGLGRDYGYAAVFQRQVELLGRSGDVLIALSTSGNSPNVLNAAQAAAEKGIAVIALTSEPGGKLAPLADVWLPAQTRDSTCAENVHLSVLLVLGECLRDLVHGERGAGSPDDEQAQIVELLQRRLHELAQTVAACHEQVGPFTRAVMWVRDSFERGHQLLVCGNGGSASLCTHLATMCMGRPYGTRPMPVVVLAALTPPLTALANDYDYDYIYARQLEAFGRSGDVFLAFAADEAANVLSAVKAAKAKGLPVIVLTRQSAGAVTQLADASLSGGTDDTHLCEVVHKILVLTLAQAARTLMQPPVKPW